MRKTLLYNMSQRIKATYRMKMAVCSCLFLSLWLLASCANPGKGPDGGPYDETPPKIMSMTPMIGQNNVQPKKVSIVFNELIKLENASEKIIVSPQIGRAHV